MRSACWFRHNVCADVRVHAFVCVCVCACVRRAIVRSCVRRRMRACVVGWVRQCISFATIDDLKSKIHNLFERFDDDDEGCLNFDTLNAGLGRVGVHPLSMGEFEVVTGC